MGYGYKIVKRIFEKIFGDIDVLRKNNLENKLKKIKEMLAQGCSYKKIANDAHVDFSTISKIKKQIKGESYEKKYCR